MTSIERIRTTRALICLVWMVGIATQARAQVPAPWASADIGSPSIAGRASQSGTTFSITGAGNDIWNTSDQFHFMYQPVDGDLEVVARVASIQQAHQWSKAGVMIRAALTPGAAHAYMLGSAAKGWAFQRRLTNGASSANTPGSFATPPGWVKLVRTGNIIRGYESTDGANWVLIGSETISMPNTVYVGLAVTSHNSNMASTASFTNVNVVRTSTANQPPTVTLTAPANGTTYSAPASISFMATASDTDGTVSRVDFYAGSQLIQSDTSSPYGATWNNVAAGTYDLTAVARDDDNATATSSIARVTVGTPANQPPTASITSPANGATFAVGATVTINANAADSNGTITKVDFYRGTTLISTDTSSPYSATWSNAAAGSYALTVVAFDNGGASTTSAAVNVTVGAQPPPAAPVAFVQQRGADAGTTTSAALTFSAANGAGNFIAVAIRASGVDQVFTVRDSRGNTYRRAHQFNVTRDNVSFAIFYAENVAAGSNTVTVSDTKSGTLRVSVAEYSGVATTGAFVTSAGAEGSGMSPNSGVVTASPGALVVGAIMTANPANMSGGSGFTMRSYVPGNPSTKLALEDRVQATSGSVAATAAIGATDAWGSIVTVFRAGGSGTPNPAPTVSITSPANSATFTAGANVTINANAADSNGTISKVDFYRGSTLIASDTSAPYSATWSNAAAGSYALTAIAVDNGGASTTSAAVNVTVNSTTNQPPTVSVTSPASGATFAAGANITINANAADSNGTVTRVDFYRGSTLIAQDSSAPYSATWNGAAAGSYALTAIAYDNGGASTTSAAVNVTVSGGTSPLPTRVVFNPSPDHATSSVTSYSVALRRAGDAATATPVATKDLGKPSPVNNDITVDISDIVNPLPAGSYYAIVTAIGPGGLGASTPSGNFTK